MEIIKEHRCANTWRKWSDLSADDPDGMCLSIFGCHFRSVNQMETILEDRCPHPPNVAWHCNATAVLMGLGILTGRCACSAKTKQMVRDAVSENEKLKAKVRRLHGVVL